MAGQSELLKNWKDMLKRIKTADYIIYFNKTYPYEILEPIIFEDGEKIYENNFGGILKYNK